jgi:hypothetical protein
MERLDNDHKPLPQEIPAPTQPTKTAMLKPPCQTPDETGNVTDVRVIDPKITAQPEKEVVDLARPLLRSSRYSFEARKNAECSLLLARQQKLGLNPYGFHSQENLAESFEDITLGHSTSSDAETPSASESPFLDW